MKRLISLILLFLIIDVSAATSIIDLQSRIINVNVLENFSASLYSSSPVQVIA